MALFKNKINFSIFIRRVHVSDTTRQLDSLWLKGVEREYRHLFYDLLWWAHFLTKKKLWTRCSLAFPPQSVLTLQQSQHSPTQNLRGGAEDGALPVLSKERFWKVGQTSRKIGRKKVIGVLIRTEILISDFFSCFRSSAWNIAGFSWCQRERTVFRGSGYRDAAWQHP
jgi:hypothetical protein